MLGARDGGKHLKIIITASTAATLMSTAAEAGISFKSYQTHSHVAVAVDPDVTYSVEPIRTDGKVVGLKLILDNIKDDLDDLSGSTDARTDKVMVVRTPIAGGKRVIYQFLLSEKARKAGIEFFDYRNKAPSEIALDYWLKAQPQNTAAGSVGKKPTVIKGSAAAKKPTVARKAAAPAFGGCGQPLDLASEGVANYKVYHRSFDYRGFFKLQTADASYKYPLVTPKAGEALGERSKEVSHYRLAHKLYREQKYALVLRTIGFFEAQYPKSPLVKELDFLKANTFLNLARVLRTERYNEQALELFRRTAVEAPDTERGRLSLELVVQELMARNTSVFALEYALIGAEQKVAEGVDPRTPAVYRLASAEALFSLGEMDRAERAYQNVIDTDKALAPEAAFRLGEVMSARKFWDRAVMYYEKALKDYPKEADRYPTAFFNLAEGYFRLGRYADAEKTYREFDKRFPADDYLWAARLRIAELEQMKIKSPDPKLHEKIADLYESVVNRHPYTPGAVMAELRLARCYRNLPASDRTRAFFDDFFASRDDKNLESPLVDAFEAGQWADLAEATFYLNNGEPRLALKRADEYRLKLSKSPLAESFRKVFAQAVVDLVAKLGKDTEEGSSKELLAVDEHYGDIAPKPLPVAYALAVAKGRLQTGDMAGVAEKLGAVEGRLAEATDGEKDWYHLLRARERRLLGEKAETVTAELAQMRDRGDLVVEKYDELVQSSLHRNDLKAALAFDNRILDTELAAKLTMERRFSTELRRLDTMERLGDNAEAAKNADRVLLKYGTETQFPQLIARLKDLRAQALYDSGDYKGAVEALSEILDATPNHPRHAEFEFMRGKGLAKLGRDNEALETFQKLARAPANDVWKKSAQAELDQLQWESKVSNLIKDKDRRSSQ